MKKLLSILTVLALAALPLAAQAPEPPAEEPLEQEQEYGAESEAQSEFDPVTDESQEPVEPMASDSEIESESEFGSEEEELPRTASPLALIALLGGAGTAAGFGVRRLRTK